MKLSYAIENVIKSKENQDDVDSEEFCQELGLEYGHVNYKLFNDRFKSYWLAKWLCTDTWVGMKVYFLDDEAICISVQTARKSGTDYEFASKESADKLRKFILELRGLDDEDDVQLYDPDYEMED